MERGWLRAKRSARRRPVVGDVRKSLHERGDETKFYEPFARWLCLNEDCTHYAVTGKKTVGRGKWTTPDVIGLVKCPETALAKFNTEVVTAEIKAGTGWDDLITSFAQACSYKLSSHMSWVVVPNAADTEALDRLRVLCHMFGVGLAVFDPNDPLEAMEFDDRIRPRKGEPEYFYAEQLLKDKNFKNRPEAEDLQ